MKISRIKIRPLFSIILILFLVYSCRKSDHPVSYSYYVSKSFQTTYNEAYITSIIDVASATLPELKAIKPLVSSDVNVYKVVYNTTLYGEKIEASGLICIPGTPGDYPVLSFQNGTNTLFSDAPSANPTNYTYQLIEFIASMGYIVVIADYPGFGQSSAKTHPYLIKEPTVQSLVDLLYTAREMVEPEFPGITAKNEFYLLGYSQGGWATLALHKAIELDYSNDFNLKGSACGAGPYDILKLLNGMVTLETYPMPEYLAYIVNAYSAYGQFTNPVADIFNEPYASRLSSLFNGRLASDQINAQLTTSIPALLNPDFISGFGASQKYSTVIEALSNNSVSGWKTSVPILLTHGDQDKYVDPSSTENLYTSMIGAGTSADMLTKQIIPGFGHSDGAIPCMIQGILFLSNLKNSK